MGQGSTALAGFSSTAGPSQMTVTSEEQRLAAEDLYRDANSLIYGDSNPSEDAIDRVVSKINKEYVPRFSEVQVHLHPQIVSTRRGSFLANVSTRRKETLHISTNTIASSTRRLVLFDQHVRFVHSLSCPTIDRTILRQIYQRDPCKFRAWYGSVGWPWYSDGFSVSVYIILPRKAYGSFICVGNL